MGIELKNHMRTLTMENINKTKHEPAVIPALKNGNAFHALAKQAGFFQRRRAENAASREAAVHFSSLRVASIQAEAEVAAASLTSAKAQIMASLMSSATTQIGAQMVDLNARASASQLRLSAASSAEQISHLNNRAETVEALKALARDGNVDVEESAVLIELAHGDSLDDIRRARRRNGRTKDLIDLLHDLALDSVVGPNKADAA